jgi:hypothetical protein
MLKHKASHRSCQVPVQPRCAQHLLCLLLLLLLLCTRACAASRFSSGTPCCSNGPCGSQHTGSCVHPPAAPLRGPTHSHRQGCCSRWGGQTQSSHCPVPASAAVTASQCCLAPHCCCDRALPTACCELWSRCPPAAAAAVCRSSWLWNRCYPVRCCTVPACRMP